jgi:hypothetical protein
MIKWAGWLIALFAAAHTLGALTVEEAARHAARGSAGRCGGRTSRT